MKKISILLSILLFFTSLFKIPIILVAKKFYDENSYISSTDSAYKIGKKKRRKAPKKEATGKTEPVAEDSSSGEEHDNVAITMELSDKTAKPPKKFLLPIMYKQINYPHRLQAPRKMLEMYLQKTDPTGEKGDGSQNVTVNKAQTVVDEKGDTKPEDLPSTVEKDATESTSAQETVDNTGTKETAQTTEANKQKEEKEVGLDYLKVFGSIKEVNEFLDMESEYLFFLCDK